VRLHQAIIFLGTLAQAVTVANHWAYDGSIRASIAQPLAIMLIGAALAAVSVFRPDIYWKHRKLVTTLGRCLICSIPSFRQTGVGTALMLENNPQLGWRGVASDLARIMQGGVRETSRHCRPAQVRIQKPYP
jgi:hypothetical protein